MTTPQIRLVPIGDLKPWANNPRVIPETAVAELAAYIQEIGFRDPVETDGDLNIVAGHTRYLAAKRCDLDLVPTIVHDDMTPAEANAYRIASNKLAENTSWSKSLLADELASLDGEVDMHLLGFDDNEIDKLFDITPEGGEEPDTSKPAPKTFSVTRSGEVWDLGPHQLVIGAGHEAQADQIIKGWQKKAKAKATHEGQPFAEIEKARKIEEEAAHATD